MTGFLKDILRRRELLWLLVDRNLKIRYKSSVLGFFWSLLTPLLLIVIYAVFASILKFNLGRPNYLQMLVTGIITWQFLAMCLNDSLSAVMGNANLIKKTAFPRMILPLSMVLANLVNFVLTLVVLGVYLQLTGLSFCYMYWLPLLMVTQVALCLGMALLLSAGNVFFRDTEHILGVLTLAWFFMTPIFYEVSMQREAVGRLFPGNDWLVFLNPMTGLVCAYRTLFMGMTHPGRHYLAISFAVAWAVLVLGTIVFQKTQARFADEL